jgi:hypothetical protein
MLVFRSLVRNSTFVKYFQCKSFCRYTVSLSSKINHRDTGEAELFKTSAKNDKVNHDGFKLPDKHKSKKKAQANRRLEENRSISSKGSKGIRSANKATDPSGTQTESYHEIEENDELLSGIEAEKPIVPVSNVAPSLFQKTELKPLHPEIDGNIGEELSGPLEKGLKIIFIEKLLNLIQVSINKEKVKNALDKFAVTKCVAELAKEVGLSGF